MNPIHVLYVIAIVLILFLIVHSAFLLKGNSYNKHHTDIVTETLKKVDDVHEKVNQLHSKLV